MNLIIPDPRLGRWLTVDPYHEFHSPYVGMGNNPINLIDPDGGSTEWVPTVNPDGSTSYIAEKGDNAATFASQFGVTPAQANIIVGTGTKQGCEVSGQTVNEVLGKNGVLRLNLKSKEATSQRIINQFIFALNHSKSQGATGFDMTTYFSNIGHKTQGDHHLKGNISIKGINVGVQLSLQFHTSVGTMFDGEKNSINNPSFFSNSLSKTEQGNGTLFGGNQSIDSYFIESGFKINGKYQWTGRTRFSVLSKNANKFEKNVFEKNYPKYIYHKSIRNKNSKT
jgi:hypothetical protein